MILEITVILFANKYRSVLYFVLNLIRTKLPDIRQRHLVQHLLKVLPLDPHQLTQEQKKSRYQSPFLDRIKDSMLYLF